MSTIAYYYEGEISEEKQGRGKYRIKQKGKNWDKIVVEKSEENETCGREDNNETDAKESGFREIHRINLRIMYSFDDCE